VQVFDHVTSNEGLLLPVKELVKLCHAKGILVLVDGAHGLGSQLPFSPANVSIVSHCTKKHTGQKMP
jgi:selenocysteine lyase/cysteine desulfurase